MTKLSNTEEGLPKNIILIDAQKKRQSLLKDAIKDNGFTLLDIQKGTDCLLMQTQALKPDVIVIGIDTPDNQTLEDLLTLKNNCPTTIVIFAEKNTPHIIQQAIKMGVSAYIVDDIQPHRISNIIYIAHARFIEYQLLNNELIKTKAELANRKTIDRAKGLLMQQKNISESEAFQMMRKMSMNKGIPIADVAINIIDVFDLMSI